MESVRFIDEDLFNEIITEIKSLRKERNDYIHGIWIIKTDKNGYTPATCSRKKISFKQSSSEKMWKQECIPKKISLENLGDTAKRLDDL